jgi:predicted acetyltransferase
MGPSYVIRPVPADEFDAIHALTRTAFHDTSAGEGRELDRTLHEAAREIGAYYGDTLVGVTGAFTRDLTVPGCPVPVACVTNVAVAAAHTRRGLLTQMMRRQLTELHETDAEPVAALWASESGIYRRFGYGLATRHARLSVPAREVAFLHPVPPGDPLRTGPATDPALFDAAVEVYGRIQPAAVGFLTRTGAWWDHRLTDHESSRGGKGPLQIAIHDGPDGPDGYVLYAIEPDWQDDGPLGTAHVRELVAGSPATEAALWAYLLRLDLIAYVASNITPLDVPLPHLLNHPRRARLYPGDNLWVRLADVGRALESRTYSAEIDVVLEVADEFCPWNAGRWRLKGGPDGASCTRTGDSPALALTSLDLGAAYLGGTTLAAMARTGSVAELQPGALRAASVAFAEPLAPYCPEIF